MSPHLRKLFTDVKNVGHKRAGSANLFIRGSRSRTQLKSDPVSLMIFDEVEEMVYVNIELALERMSGQDMTQAFLLSTPSVEGIGINFYYQSSTQEHFFFHCPHCGKMIELDHTDDENNCLIITADTADDPKILDSHIICPRPSCHGIIEHEKKTEYYRNGWEWVPTRESINVGNTINQLYSTMDACHPSKLAITYLKAQNSEELMQEYHNNKRGTTYTPKGSRVTVDDIEACKSDHVMLSHGIMGKFTTIGVDTGNVLHFEIVEWYQNPKATSDSDLSGMFFPRVIKVGTVSTFEEIDTLVMEYYCVYVVVDAIPEKRESEVAFGF
jgi:phage terminase large subunit GpA-like protein